MTGEMKVKFIHQLGGNSTCGILYMQLHELAVEVCVMRVHINARVPHHSTLSPHNHTTLEPQSNEHNWLLKSAEIGCHSRHTELV
jgi:hypothetical protein